MWAAKDKILKKVTFAGIVKSSFKTAFLFFAVYRAVTVVFKSWNISVIRPLL